MRSFRFFALVCALLLSALAVVSCQKKSEAADNESGAFEGSKVISVGVVKASRQPISRDLTLSSELVPFQEIDIFAKESGYIKQILVDYGSHVKKGQLLAVLEIPELQIQLDQDRAAAKSQADQVTNAQHQLARLSAQHNVLHLEYERFAGVAQSKPGLVAQQEVDDVQGRDLASEAQVEGARSNVDVAQSTLAADRAKLSRDSAVYDYSRITAPFAGVVTQRYANLGMLLASGTSSSTQPLPLVKLSQVDLFRLVIPVPESYVRYVRIGDPVQVRVPSLDRDVPGKVARFAFDVHDSTRTMHTEVDVPNPKNLLVPGLYAEATIALNRSADALVVPIQAVDRQSKTTTVAIVDPQNHVQMRTVEIGVETDSLAEILSGLKTGDQVIVSDRAGLTPGQSVKPQVTSSDSYNSKS